MRLLPGSKGMIFLLGGIDLEMSVIKEMLQEQGYRYCDNGLSWENATLSAYEKDIVQYSVEDIVLVGIELREDIAVPDNYFAVDHHNDRGAEPSSLEQVAALINRPLNRYQQLVAANDKGYIDGMKIIGATSEEIQQIRAADRRSQGVTADEEAEAELLLASLNRNVFPLVIDTDLRRFSPITDRLYPISEYIIANQREMVYYGSRCINRLKQEFARELCSDEAYFGGAGSSSFFGIASCCSHFEDCKQRMIKVFEQ